MVTFQVKMKVLAIEHVVSLWLRWLILSTTIASFINYVIQNCNLQFDLIRQKLKSSIFAQLTWYSSYVDCRPIGWCWVQSTMIGRLWLFIKRPSAGSWRKTSISPVSTWNWSQFPTLLYVLHVKYWILIKCSTSICPLKWLLSLRSGQTEGIYYGRG